MEFLVQAEHHSLDVVIDQLCRDLCGFREVAISEMLEYVQDAILRGSDFQVCFQQQPNSGRCFPAWERPWIGGDRTLKVTYYANGNEDDLANNSQQFFEQVGLGIVLAHVPDFVDKTVRFSMTLQSFHKDYPQYAALADKVSAVLRDMVSGEYYSRIRT